jgi:hypothetical protein
VKIRQRRKGVDLKKEFSSSAPDHKTEAQAVPAVFSSRLASTVVSSEIRRQIRSRAVGHFSSAVAQVGQRMKESSQRSDSMALHACEGSGQALDWVMMAEARAIVLVAEGIVAGDSDCPAGAPVAPDAWLPRRLGVPSPHVPLPLDLRQPSKRRLLRGRRATRQAKEFDGRKCEAGPPGREAAASRLLIRKCPQGRRTIPRGTMAVKLAIN